MKGKLYLIPNLLGEGDPKTILPLQVLDILNHIKHFIVEDIRNARRFLSKTYQAIEIDQLTFYILNEHTHPKEYSEMLKPLNEHDMGIISDAGVPGVADPGAELVRAAHSKNIQVIPLIGPSSILMAMMASGLNGQNFAFNGYLPIKNPDRSNRIKFYEKKSTD